MHKLMNLDLGQKKHVYLGISCILNVKKMVVIFKFPYRVGKAVYIK